MKALRGERRVLTTKHENRIGTPTPSPSPYSGGGEQEDGMWAADGITLPGW